MSMTYGHSATETMVSIVEGTERDTGIAHELEEIASYFREVRKKYSKFEGSLSTYSFGSSTGRNANQHGKSA